MSTTTTTTTAAKAIPSTQRAWIVERQGPPSRAVSLKEDWPVSSKLAKDDVLVKVEAAALNPLGYKLMRLAPNFFASRPLIAEYDLSGTIADANGTRFSNGDPVFGFIAPPIAMKTRQGALAQYVRVPSSHLVPRPANITATQGAAFTLAGQTAYQAVLAEVKLEAGQTIFINGGSSSVGAYAIQIAKAKGAAKVVASTTGEYEEFVRSLGADEVVDYTKTPLHEHFKANPPSPKFHAIIDAVGLTNPSLYLHSAAYLAPGGIFISTSPHPKSVTASEVGNYLKTLWVSTVPTWLGGVPRKFRTVMLQHKQEDLEDMLAMINAGTLKPVIDSVFEFDDVLKAYERIMTMGAKGKVVVKVDPNAT